MEKDPKLLIEKYLSDKATVEEQAALEDWYAKVLPDGPALAPEKIEMHHNEVLTRIQFSRKRAFWPYFTKVAVAASLLVFVGIGYIYQTRFQKTVPVAISHAAHEILPGGNKAILKLADGRVIDLDQKGSGPIAVQNGVVAHQLNNGILKYDTKGNGKLSLQTNVINIPRGGKFQLVLSDGSRVWINAMSELKFPSAFSGNERVVELSGEAYFEVAKDSRRPFVVKTANQQVQVLGTHFNVNSYPDETEIKTTLAEGRVLVTSGGKSVSLKPGEQSRLNRGFNSLSLVRDIDLEEELSWKNEIFAFNNDDIKTVMRQLSRWYDLDVIYKGKVSNERYFGEIPRNSKLSEVFEILQLNHVDIKITGKTMVITGN